MQGVHAGTNDWLVFIQILCCGFKWYQGEYGWVIFDVFSNSDLNVFCFEYFKQQDEEEYCGKSHLQLCEGTKLAYFRLEACNTCNLFQWSEEKHESQSWQQAQWWAK